MVVRQRYGQRFPHAERDHACDHEGCQTVVRDPTERFCHEHTLREQRSLPCAVSGCPHPASERDGVCLWHWRPAPEPPEPGPLPMGRGSSAGAFEEALCVPCERHGAAICEPCWELPYSLCGDRVNRALAGAS